jgi:mRNA interferase MazF
MEVIQGDIFWVRLPGRNDSSPAFTHPHVVIQGDLFNRSRINTVITCVITSNFHRASLPGNVALAKGEGNLDRRCVVNVTQLYTVDRMQLVEKIGTLSRTRMKEIFEGIRLVLGMATL